MSHIGAMKRKPPAFETMAEQSHRNPATVAFSSHQSHQPGQRTYGRAQAEGAETNHQPAFRDAPVDQNQPDVHMQQREAEKAADLESLADALAAFRQLHRELDQWERVHLARGLAAVLAGCYGVGAIEAALALTPEIERSPSAKLPADPFYQRLHLEIFERALNEIWAAPARRFPHFGPIEAS
ncbi:hypothetical protein [Acidisphaera sp. S103]|uniref:hypothetical protein n=1 Tax=Acidisphaera sp. S103 TaxID=1747223 RepID=UPI00131B8DB3|nr:hypothetical protein [Acidisphaera sp. S103]